MASTFFSRKSQSVGQKRIGLVHSPQAQRRFEVCRALVIVLVLTQLAGCTETLLKLASAEINRQFPPVSFDSLRVASVQRSAAGLAKVTQPAILLNVPMADIGKQFSKMAADASKGPFTVLASSAAADGQGMSVTVEVAYRFERPKGRVVLKLSGWAGVSVNGSEAVIQPALRNMEIVSVSLDHFPFIGSAAAKLIATDLINGVGAFRDNINGQLKPIVYKLDPESVGLSPGESKFLTPSGEVVAIPAITLGAVAALIDSDGLRLVGNLNIVAVTKRSVVANDGYDQYRQSFLAAANLVRPGQTTFVPGVFVSSEFLKRLLGGQFNPNFPLARARRVMGGEFDR
jgi:hypothetical protein